MLSERKAAILQAIVEGYISTSEPVGSTQIVKDTSLDVSSATVRSDMVALEDDGYLNQPHTSAGRVPSDKGYRYFVDSLMEPFTLGRTQQQKVSSFFEAAQGELERMLEDTSSFLAQLTHYAAVVVGPTPEASPLRGIQVVRLNDEQALVVLVHANAVITKRVVSIDTATTDEVLQDAARSMIASHVDGSEDIDIDPNTQTVLSLLETAVAEEDESPLFVGGASTVAGIFDAVDQVQDVLQVLEKQYMVVTLIKDLVQRGVEVSIGAETGVEPLSECSLVLSPIEVDGVTAGSIGLLGPTRMNYGHAMATVALVSQQLGHHLREGAS